MKEQLKITKRMHSENISKLQEAVLSIKAKYLKQEEEEAAAGSNAGDQAATGEIASTARATKTVD